MMQDYAAPAIGIAYCKNTTENGNWCRSYDEIDAFMAQTRFYFQALWTKVNIDKFANDPLLPDIF